MLIKGERAPWATLGELVAARAAQRNDALWVEVDGNRLTWHEVDRLADRVASALAKLGVAKGDRVSCFMANSIEVLFVWFGTVKLGAIWNPINAGLRGDDLAYVLADVAPKVLVVDADNAHKIDELSGRGSYRRFVVGAAGLAGYEPFDALLREDAAAPRIEIGPADPAVLLYTGGTTGLPKGALLPHFAWICAGYRYREAFGATAADRNFTALPLYHVGALMGGVIAPLICNMSCVVDRSFSLTNYWRRVRESEATIADVIGTIMILLCRQPPSPSDRDHRLRACIAVVSQAPSHLPAEFSRRFGVKLVNLYSLTEVGGLLAIFNPIDSPRPEANGKPWGWADVRIVGDNDESLPPGAIGQIVLRPTVPFSFMLGYYNSPVRTLECYRNLWFHTGDLGYLDEDGWLFFTGRQAHWLRRRGENISTHEVESILSRYPGIAEVVVVGVPSELGDEEVKAFIIPDQGVAIDPVALVRWCEKKMAGFKVPRFIAFTEDFPRSAAKREVERHKLRALPNADAWDSEKVLGRRRQGQAVGS